MSFKLIILGSNSAFPMANRFTTAQALNVNERFFLIDCGEGTQMQLRKHKISFARISHIFISHLHGDHFYGLFGFLSTLSLLGRKESLHIYAHRKLQLLIEQLHTAINYKTTFKIVFHPLEYDKPKKIFENKIMEVYSIPLKHRVKTCGFFFKERQRPANLRKDMLDFYQIPIADRMSIKNGADFITAEGKVIENKRLVKPAPKPTSYAFFSDTAYTDKHLDLIEGVDLLYHEATFRISESSEAKQTYHSTTRDAAQIAIKAKAKKLAIGHFSSRYMNNLADLHTEVKSYFANTEIATDGKIFELP